MTKTTIRTRPFDPAEYLNSEASIAAFVSDAMESGDSVIIQNALNTAARARGMAQIAEDSGLGRESLYKALRPDAKPQFGTIVKVLNALGVRLVAEPAVRARKTTRNVARDAVFVGASTKAPAQKSPAKRAASKRKSFDA